MENADVGFKRLDEQGELACHPAAANGKDLSDKAVCRITAQIGSELGIFIGADQAPERYLAFQAILKTRIGLNLGWKVSRVLDKVLCDHIDLNIVWRDLDSDGLNISQLGATRRAVGGSQLLSLIHISEPTRPY